MPRITKEPNERRQEILDTAMKLFYENGYEKTSITDIAKYMNVAQGLCYRYFPSKEILFDSAIDQYAQTLVDKMLSILNDKNKTLKQIIEEVPTFIDIETDDNLYYKICHGEQNKKIHDQLSLKVCEKLVPIVKKQIELAHSRGEIDVPDSDTTAYFCVYGQQGILLRNDISNDEKIERIRSFLTYLMNI
ncbi:TetR/AcrR family transcriptional regulator [Clostridioides sp. ES-S-0001-02]|uniref:TetR/AcrR family transcriptional regulator n=1 Tax=Clostridioides sp. ES-S-0001-02 TaxID=2770770 RepID=UPI001D12681D|nr:TetR/AcrR family transcriptional regulator [Clostridioides sp. ES-S-0001-02]